PSGTGAPGVNLRLGDRPVLTGLDTTTRPARLANSAAIAHVFPVASSATSSVGPRSAANARTPSGVVANLPACLTTPFSHSATCAKSRYTPNPIQRRLHCSLIATSPSVTDDSDVGSGWAKRHLRIRAQRNRADRRGGRLTTRALSPARNTGLP